jgi:kynurenine formamidase
MYFDRHPGPQPEVIDYLIDEKKIRWLGGDLASMDHSMYVRIRWMRPDLVREYEQMTGRPIEETLPEKDFEYVHYRTARSNVCMLENLGGELAEVAGRRCVLGAFPWRWEGGEGCVCRVAAFLDLDQPGIEGASPPGSLPVRPDASNTPARIMASQSDTKVSY